MNHQPHPGAQLSVFAIIQGLRHQVFITDISDPPARCSYSSRATAAMPGVSDRHRTARQDLHLLLNGEHAFAEPQKLRYRLLHVATGLRPYYSPHHLRIAHHWPWAGELATAYARLAALAALPKPIG